MQRMFRSATLQLTAWYLAIVMIISVTFSIVIYELNSRELSSRLESLQHSLIQDWVFNNPLTRTNLYQSGPGSLLYTEKEHANAQMVGSLIYINLILFIAGGLGSYFLARRTLRPISEAHEAQSRFTSDASHELRTPLAAMKAELEVSLRDPTLSPEESRELLESNLEEVNKLIKLSEMLLRLSRLDHGEQLETELVDVAAVLKDVLRAYNPVRKRFIVTGKQKAVIRANEPALHELLTILVDNAIKYSPAKSDIRMRLFTQRGFIAFEISNQGDKIPDDILPKLFDRFFRADKSRTNGADKGYGLGLSIAQKIVTIHHGTIAVKSTADKTTFTVLLPNIK